jgi:hypothetical protein
MKKITTLSDFKIEISKIKKVESITGKIYHSISIMDDKIRFVRSHKVDYEYIQIEELFNFYRSIENELDLKTTTAKNFISGRVQSPATAILRTIF